MRLPAHAAEPALSVVIPCFDEEENVPILAEELRKELGIAGIDSYEVIFVDDGSTDATAQRVIDEIERAPEGHFRLIRLAENSGQSAAIEAGVHRARGEILVVMDGDLQHPPADVPKLLAPIRSGSADCVCGWRANREESETRYRRLQSRVANAMRDRITGDEIRDAGCTFRAFRRECLERVKLFRGMHRFLPTLIRLEGHRVVEVPVASRPRLYGTSKYGLWNRLFVGLYDVFAVRWMRSRVVRWRIAEER